MSYIAPQIQEKFDTLSVNLQDQILSRDVKIYTLQDLVQILGKIVKEAER
ncbi:hypothetical protein FACS189418_1260 [Clostridia bacterium]|nr:hypothetical protein FACS189418_1260 [Clostridia bacterium]